MVIPTFAVLMEKPVQNDVDIVAGIEATQSEPITTNVLDIRLAVFLAVPK
jgi:hypothetical protein